MTFDDLLGGCNDAFFDAFADAETVVWTAEDGSQSTYEAIVDRNPDVRDRAESAMTTRDVVVSLRADPAKLAGPATASVGKCKVTFRPAVGGTVTTLGVRQVLPESDRAMWVLRVH